MAKTGNSNYLTGRVARLVRDRGFGFIKDDDSETQFFFHMSAFSGHFETLTEGDRVRFVRDSKREEKGPRADAVEKMAG